MTRQKRISGTRYQIGKALRPAINAVLGMKKTSDERITSDRALEILASAGDALIARQTHLGGTGYTVEDGRPVKEAVETVEYFFKGGDRYQGETFFDTQRFKGRHTVYSDGNQEKHYLDLATEFTKPYWADFMKRWEPNYEGTFSFSKSK